MRVVLYIMSSSCHLDPLVYLSHHFHWIYEFPENCLHNIDIIDMKKDT